MSSIWDRFANRVRDAMEREGTGAGRPPTEVQGMSDKLGLPRISDDALATELERRRRTRGKLANRRPAGSDELDAMADARRISIRKTSLSKAYASLEIRSGSTRYEIEAAYRKLLRQYHPDRHIGDDEQHKSAVALATSLTDGYLALMSQFERR